MDLAHPTYTRRQSPPDSSPSRNLQGEFPAARAQSNPAIVLRDSLHSSHTISAKRAFSHQKHQYPGRKLGEKLNSTGHWPRRTLSTADVPIAKADIGVPEAASVVSARALWNSLASWRPRKAADGGRLQKTAGPSAAPESEQICGDARIAPAVRNWCCLLWNVVIQYRLRFALLNQSVQKSASA
jgi:hypothetical protein